MSTPYYLNSLLCLTALTLIGCSSGTTNSPTITQGPAETSGINTGNNGDTSDKTQPTENDDTQSTDNATTILSNYSPLDDQSLLTMDYERARFPQVANSTSVNGHWLFVHQGTIYSPDDDKIAQLASKSISQLSIAEDGALLSTECDANSSVSDSLPFVNGQYLKVSTNHSDNFLETISLTIDDNLSELSGTIRFNDLTTNDVLAQTHFKAYKVANNDEHEGFSIGTLQLTALTQPFDASKTINAQKDFTLHCMDYSQDFFDNGTATDVQKSVYFTETESSAELILRGTNKDGESIRMFLSQMGMTQYILGKYHCCPVKKLT